jgi:hypothetical protein
MFSYLYLPFRRRPMPVESCLLLSIFHYSSMCYFFKSKSPFLKGDFIDLPLPHFLKGGMEGFAFPYFTHTGLHLTFAVPEYRRGDSCSCSLVKTCLSLFGRMVDANPIASFIAHGVPLL